MTTRRPFSDPQDPVPRVSNIKSQGPFSVTAPSTGRMRLGLVTHVEDSAMGRGGTLRTLTEPLLAGRSRARNPCRSGFV